MEEPKQEQRQEMKQLETIASENAQIRRLKGKRVIIDTDSSHIEKDKNEGAGHLTNFIRKEYQDKEKIEQASKLFIYTVSAYLALL